MSDGSVIPSLPHGTLAKALQRLSVSGITAGIYEVVGAYPQTRHCHPLPAIGMVLQGECRTQFSNQELIETPDVVTIEPANQPHVDVMIGPYHLSCAIEVADSRLADHPRLRRMLTQPQTLGPPFGRMVRSIVRELRLNDEGSPLAVAGLSSELMAALVRHRGLSPGRDAERWIQRVEEYLRANFLAKPSMEQIAREVKRHPAHVSRAFRNRKGCTLGEFCRRLRVERACRLLAATEMPIAAVALESGYCDQAGLTRALKQVVNTTPAEFRAARRRSSAPSASPEQSARCSGS